MLNGHILGHLDFIPPNSLMTFRIEPRVPTPECPNPENWHAYDDISAEVEVLEFWAQMVRAMKPKLIVETGSYLGLSAAYMGRALLKTDSANSLYSKLTVSFVKGPSFLSKDRTVQSASIDGCSRRFMGRWMGRLTFCCWTPTRPCVCRHSITFGLVSGRMPLLCSTMYARTNGTSPCASNWLCVLALISYSRFRIYSCVIALADFGTDGSGSPANRLFTRPARKSAKGPISSPTLAFSSAFMYVCRSATAMTVHGYPPAPIMRFIKNRPMRPLPSM